MPLNSFKNPKIIEFLNQRDLTCQSKTNIPIQEPLFECIPNVIVFSDYEALNTKTFKIKLRNKDQVARRVKIINPETNLFKVKPCFKGENNKNGNKVAPGLDVSYEILFSPEKKIDYNFDLTIVTEREKFLIPIIALGKKSLLDFPDLINFGNQCPVKYKTEKSIVIHNKGEKSSKWEIKLPKNFSCNKVEGLLECNSSE